MPSRIIQTPQRPQGRLDWALIAPVVVLDLGARLAAPAAVLALAHARVNTALVSAALVTGLAAIRALVVGRVQAVSVRRLWRALIVATRGRSVPLLQARSDEHRSAALMEAVAQVASARAGVITRMLADGLAVLAVLVATVLVVGPLWVGIGVAALGLGGAVVMATQRRMRAADRRAFEHFVHAAHGFEVLADAATELRAHACEERHSARLSETVEQMAEEQRRATRYSSLAGLFPVGIALLVATASLGVKPAALVEAIGGRMVDVGVLAMTGAFFAFGLARSVEAWGRSAPQRQVLRSYIDGTPAPVASGAKAVDLRAAMIEFDAVSVTYAGADRATPGDVKLQWKADRGLALLGPNGAGKSTLALCLIGLLQPTAGRLVIDGVASTAIDWSTLRQAAVYVPQQGYLAADRSVEWHLRLLASEVVTRDALEAALREVGLWEVLSRRGVPFQVAASQLSGGERKRLHLARALLGEPQLIILDEPEAGLDAEARAWLRGYIARLATTARVLLIAHDPSVIPEEFQQLTVCAA